MEKEKTNNEAAHPPPVDNINLSIGGEIRNYKVEHLSDDAKNKLARVNQDETQVLPLFQRLFTLAALGARVEADAMEQSLPNKYEVVKQPKAEEEAPEQPNGKAADK